MVRNGSTQISWKPAIAFMYMGAGILLLTVAIGCLAMFHFALGGSGAKFTFQHTRPLHVSLAIGWIYATLIGLIYHFLPGACERPLFSPKLAQIHFFWFAGLGAAIVTALASGWFGGREYWAFPPIFSLGILVSWLLFAINFLATLRGRKKPFPVYIWMWLTGLIGFTFTYGESLLWLLPHFGGNAIRETTVQWKSYGAMVGSWNMLIYGTQFYVMNQIEGKKDAGFAKKAFFFYFLSLTNMLFNWGHHTYPVPTSAWIRNIAYLISMSELAFFVKIIADWSKKLDAARRHRHNTSYRFFVAAEWWGYLNLVLAILISVPVINWFTHGTHVTVAHAMGSTIGINSMLLIGALCYALHPRTEREMMGWQVRKGFWLIQIALLIFWIALIGAGTFNGLVEESELRHTQVIYRLRPVFLLVLGTGLGLAAGFFLVIGKLIWLHARVASSQPEWMENASLSK